MALPPLPTADWAAEIGAAAEAQMNATANFYTTTKIPKEAPTLTLLFSTKARVQQIRRPLDIISGEQWGNRRSVRVQIPLSATSSLIEKGLVVRILGGNDPALAKVTLIVQSAINSSHAAVRTIECISELANTPLVA